MSAEIMRGTIQELMDRGADIIKIGKAAENPFTIEELDQMHQEDALAFEYERTTDTLIVTKEHE